MKFFHSSETVDFDCEDFFTLGMGWKVTVTRDEALRQTYRVLGEVPMDGWFDVSIYSMDKETIEEVLSEITGEPSTIERLLTSSWT